MTTASPYLKAALLTLAITFLGFFFISQLDAMRANELRANVEDLVFQSESERMLYLYAQTMGNSSKELCYYISSNAEAKASQAYALSEKIHAYETSNVVNEDYEKIKNQYYLSNMNLYLNMRAAEKYCGAGNYTTVLFFYKTKEDCPECRAQGGVLDSLRTTHPELRVFAFPSDSGLGFIDVFQTRHNITTVPALVIDDNVVLQGLKGQEQVEPYLPASR